MLLWLIKLTHTLLWAVFAGAIIAIAISAAIGATRWGMIFTLIALFEIGVLLLNRMRCSLTTMAARYTDDRSDNFDIFLPPWLARNNKLIFGSIFIIGEGLLIWRALSPAAWNSALDVRIGS